MYFTLERVSDNRLQCRSATPGDRLGCAQEIVWKLDCHFHMGDNTAIWVDVNTIEPSDPPDSTAVMFPGRQATQKNLTCRTIYTHVEDRRT